MKTRIVIVGLITAFFMITVVNDAEAHRWRRRTACRPARVVSVPHVIIPRVVLPPPVRIVTPVQCGTRIYVGVPRKIHRYNRYYR